MRDQVHDCWYTAQSDDVGNEMASRVRSIRSTQSLMRLLRLGFISSYGGLNRTGDLFSVGHGSLYTRDNGNTHRFNLISTIVDAVQADMATIKPAIRYQTDQADFATRRKAKKRSRVIVGQFFDMGVYDLALRACLDAEVTGTGTLRGYIDPQTGKPKLERVHPMSLIVDENQCANGDGSPPEFFLYNFVDRAHALKKWPSKRSALLEAPGPQGDDLTEFCINVDTKIDQVVVIEGWRLASSPDADDGRHVICTASGDVLFDEPWGHHVDMVFDKWKDPMNGFWGIGIAEQLEVAQRQINEHIKHIGRLQRLGSNAYVFVQGKSSVRPEQLTNAPMTIVRYEGQKPVFETVTATPPDLWTEIEKAIQQAQMMIGVSPQGIQGATQPGVTSGRAMQMQNALSDKRRAANVSRYERFFIDVAKLLGRLNDQVVEDNADHTVKGFALRGTRDHLASTKWADVMIPEDDVTVTVQSISNFVHTTPGQVEYVDKFLQMGSIPSQGTAMEQEEYPDAGALERQTNIDAEYCGMQLEDILDGALDVEPIPFQNLDVAAAMARECRLESEIDGAPTEILQRIEQFMTAVQALVPPPPAPPPGPGVPDMGAPPAMAA